MLIEKKLDALDVGCSSSTKQACVLEKRMHDFIFTAIFQLSIVKSYLKLHHGLLHALHIKDHLNQLLDWFGQLGLGASGGRQPLHCLLILPSNIKNYT